VRRTLSIAESRALVADLSAWTVHASDAADVLAAVDAQAPLGVSFCDAMVLTSASRLGCGTMLSEDLQHGRAYAGVTVRDPFLDALAA
jgi:predicted nucleic acid-binding protein